MLKSELEIGPVYHRLPQRIRTHAATCFMALILHRVMRMRLKQVGDTRSPERALEELRRIQHHEVRNKRHRAAMRGVSALTDDHAEVLKGLALRKPAISAYDCQEGSALLADPFFAPEKRHHREDNSDGIGVVGDADRLNRHRCVMQRPMLAA